MSEEEILKECTELTENKNHELGDCWDEEYSSSAIFGLIMLYKQTKKELNNLKEIEKAHQEKNGKLRVELEQEKEKNKELEIELDKTANLLNTCNKRLESISRELGLTDEHTYGYDYEEIINVITELKVKEKYWQDCFLEQVKYGNKITVSGDPVVIKNIIDTVTYNYIHKDKLKEKIEQAKQQADDDNTEEFIKISAWQELLEMK